jgi:mannose-6-phosphate isomerase-like protein (cupin superfamily)
MSGILTTPRRALIVPAHEGVRYDVLGQRLTYKVTAEHTGGAYALMECISPPRGGSPTHIHHREDEGFYILDGTLEIKCGADAFTASAGTFALLPKGVPHSFSNVGTAAARLLCIQSPAGVEAFFAHLSVMADDVRQDPVKVKELADRYGIEFTYGR